MEKSEKADDPALVKDDPGADQGAAEAVVDQCCEKLIMLKKLLACFFLPGEVVEFRAFRPSGRGRTRRYFRIWDEIDADLLGLLEPLNERGYGVYFGVNPRRARGGGRARGRRPPGGRAGR